MAIVCPMIVYDYTESVDLCWYSLCKGIRLLVHWVDWLETVNIMVIFAMH